MRYTGRRGHRQRELLGLRHFREVVHGVVSSVIDCVDGFRVPGFGHLRGAVVTPWRAPTAASSSAFSLADARASYTVSVGGKEILRQSRLGVVRDDADFTQRHRRHGQLSSKRAAKLEKVEDRYELLTSKRRQNVYRANRRVIEVQTAVGRAHGHRVPGVERRLRVSLRVPGDRREGAQDQPRGVVVQFPAGHARLAAAHRAGAFRLERNESFV